MKKYLFIFKSELMTSLQYLFDLVSGFFGYFILIFIFVNLWKYIYSDPSELINGYTVNQMIWYVIITEIGWMSINSRVLCARISEDVKSGNIAYLIVKPYDYIKYVLASHMGQKFIKFILFLIFGLFMGFMFMGEFPEHTLFTAIIVLISLILGMIINTLLTLAIGLFSFFIEDSSPFYWIYSKFLLVLGTLFPIEYFPPLLAKIVTLSPIIAMSYGPAKLFVDFSWDKAKIILLV